MKYFNSWSDHIDSIIESASKVGVITHRHGSKVQIILDKIEQLNEAIEQYCNQYGLKFLKIKDGSYYIRDINDNYKIRIETNVIAAPDLYEITISNGAS